MKKAILISIIALFLGCNQKQEPAAVNFSANSFESGKLKSFDIKQWKHFHYPYSVTVTLNNTETGKEYYSKAANGFTFFTSGTEMTYLPEGKYLCSVDGGGYFEDSVYSASYYIWNIADTLINVPAGYETTIKFNLDKTSALIVKDAATELKLIAYRNADLFFTARGDYDFAYVTPGTYAGLYTDSLGFQHGTEWFTVKADNYYYFVPFSGTKSVVTIPEFNKNEISIK